MSRSLLYILGFLLLISLAVSADEIEPPFPYAPYQMNLEEYNRFLKEKAETFLFATQTTPTDGSTVVAEGNLVLTVTFNRSVEAQTLPPLNDEWSMETPFGPIDANNLEDYGEFQYSNIPVIRDGIAYPPNTLRLRLKKTSALSLDEPLKWSLSLASAPLDGLGREAEDFHKLKPYVAWSFRLDPEKRLSSRKGGHYLRLVREGDVEELFSPLKFDFSVDGDKAVLNFTDGKSPDVLPYQAKVVSLRLPLKSLTGEELVELPFDQVEVLLTEFLYPDTCPPQQASSEVEVRRWRASRGRVWVEPSKSHVRVVRMELKLQEQDTKDAKMKSLEGFVYVRD